MNYVIKLKDNFLVVIMGSLSLILSIENHMPHNDFSEKTYRNSSI